MWGFFGLIRNSSNTKHTQNKHTNGRRKATMPPSVCGGRAQQSAHAGVRGREGRGEDTVAVGVSVQWVGEMVGVSGFEVTLRRREDLAGRVFHEGLSGIAGGTEGEGLAGAGGFSPE